MKILLLASPDTNAYYSAALTMRGHRIITPDRNVSRSENPADWMPAIIQYRECDGCLLVTDDPQMSGIGNWFATSGKPVWHHLADVPGLQIRYSRLLYAIVPVFLIVIGALIIKQSWFREEPKPIPVEENPPIASEATGSVKNPPVASEVTPPVVDKANDAVPKADERNAENCEKELQHSADLLKSSINRIQAGEETRSIVADMKQQAERVSKVCPD